MHQQSFSSFYTQMRQTYAPNGRSPNVPTARDSDLFRPHSQTITRAVQEKQPPSQPPSSLLQQQEFLSPAANRHHGVISNIQARLTAIQNSQQAQYPPQQNHSKQPHSPQPQQQQPQTQQRQRQQHQQPEQATHSFQPREHSPISAAISPPSSGSSTLNEPLRPAATPPLALHSTPSTAAAATVISHHSGNGHARTHHSSKDNDADEMLTPQEMLHLRVVEFAVPVAVRAQLEPGAEIVPVCEKATAKLFPQHLVLLRPDGVAAVELVMEELCELNEDETRCALDCVVQLKGSAQRQLIRIICADEIARGALFKLVSARRSQLESAKREQ